MDRCLGKWRWRAGFKLAKKLATVVGGPCSQANNQNRSLQGLVWEALQTFETTEHCWYDYLGDYLDEEPRRGDRKLARRKLVRAADGI